MNIYFTDKLRRSVYFFSIFLMFLLCASCSSSPSLKELNDVTYRTTGRYPDIRNPEKLAYAQVLEEILYLEPNCPSYKDYKIIDKRSTGNKKGAFGNFEEYTWIAQACGSKWSVILMFYPNNGDIATNAGLIKKIK